MATAKQPRGLELESLNLTPLLDVLFNLIFFFLLATQLKEEQRVMKVQLPKSGVTQEAPKPDESLVISVSHDGKILFREDYVTTAQLKQQLSDEAGQSAEPRPVLIRGDKKTTLQTFMDIMSVCYESGHPNVATMVEPEKRGPLPPE